MTFDAKETEALKQGDYKATGTVLKRKEGVKSSQSLLLFLKGFGLVWVTAPSATSKNRFGGSTEPMIWASFELYKSPSRFYIKSAEIKEDFLAVRSNPKSLMAAAKFYKLLPSVLYGEHENDKILTLLYSCMLLLEAACAQEVVEFRFVWRLLKYLGLAPSLTNCVSCNAKLEAADFCPDGFLCEGCLKGAPKIAKTELLQLQAAALLPQETFKSWLKAQNIEKNTKNIEFFDKSCKYLLSFFENIS